MIFQNPEIDVIQEKLVEQEKELLELKEKKMMLDMQQTKEKLKQKCKEKEMEEIQVCAMHLPYKCCGPYWVFILSTLHSQTLKCYLKSGNMFWFNTPMEYLILHNVFSSKLKWLDPKVNSK